MIQHGLEHKAEILGLLIDGREFPIELVDAAGILLAIRLIHHIEDGRILLLAHSADGVHSAPQFIQILQMGLRLGVFLIEVDVGDLLQSIEVLLHIRVFDNRRFLFIVILSFGNGVLFEIF